MDALNAEDGRGRPSLVEQYLLRNLQHVPPEVLRDPNSRAFRAAMRNLSVRTGLLPTRRETLAAMRRLSERGIVPPPRR